MGKKIMTYQTFAENDTTLKTHICKNNINTVECF